MPSLPQKLLAALDEGPSYPSELARRFAKPACSVSGALGTLRRRGLVEVLGEERAAGKGRPRVIYARAHPDVQQLEADPLRDELAILRIEARFDYDVDPQIVDLVFMNGPVAGI